MSEGLFGYAWVALAVLPIAVLLCTSYLRSFVVFAALRQGLGAERLLPPGLISLLALFVTVAVMMPVVLPIVRQIGFDGGALALLQNEPSRLFDYVDPILAFASDHADPVEVQFAARLFGPEMPAGPTVVAGFFLTELRMALVATLSVILPFWMIDLVGGQVAALMGWQISLAWFTLPAKLMAFLAVDGWHLLLSSLVDAYRLV